MLNSYLSSTLNSNPAATTKQEELYETYMKQLQEAQEASKRGVLSPIPEQASSKYDTLESSIGTSNNGTKRFDPNDQRKITGKGSYNIEEAMKEYNEDDEYENYSDDFESEEEDFSIRSSGCSGSTLDSSTVKRSQNNPE